MKKSVLFLLMFMFLFSLNIDVKAETFEFDLSDDTDLFLQMYEDYNVDELIDNTPNGAKKVLDDFEISPNNPFSFNKLFSDEGFEYLKDFILSSITSPLAITGVILVTIIVCALCASMTDNNLQSNHSLNTIATLSVISVLILPINSILNSVVDTVFAITVFMGIFIPIFAGILIAALKSSTATVYSSVMFFTCEAITYSCKNYVLPFTNCFIALSVSSGISGSVRLDGIIRIVKKFAYIIIGVAMSIFLAVLSIQGVVSSATDNVASKTAKFFISSFVPIIGPSISESLGSLKACISLLKSSVGIYAVIAILITILPLLISTVIYKLSLTLCADIAEMFFVDSIKNILTALNQALSLILAVLLCVSIMFIFSITIMSVAGGSS